MKIEIIHRILQGRDISLKEYECTHAVPMIGDIYAGIQFKDGYQRTIKQRLLFPDSPNSMVVYVDYTYPGLVKKELITSTEMDMATIVS